MNDLTVNDSLEEQQLFGHPPGLYMLFFAEMWERFSYYGMRALLLFYMIKGFLGFNDTVAYGIYGAYTALVYMTPFFGGMLADRLLGRRKAVILGGLLMAAGHLVMTMENKHMFFTALALLIVGNGFFKPNISTMVGELYPRASKKKDIGFTIFYMGINLGAAMSPIVCGYVGETYGWHYGFGLATAGMLIGVAVFVAPTILTQFLIGGGAFATAIAMPFWQDTPLQLAVRLFMSLMLLIAGGVAVAALNRGSIPKTTGAPPNPELLKRKIAGVIPVEWLVYLGSLVAVAAFAFIVQKNPVARMILYSAGVLFLVYILYEMFWRCERVARERLQVVLILAFFTVLFWACFEQAGSSLNNFADRNIDRVLEDRQVTQNDVGNEITFRLPIKTDNESLKALPILSQEQLGFANPHSEMSDRVEKAIRAEEADRNSKKSEKDKLKPDDIDELVENTLKHEALTMTGLSYLRAAAGHEDATDASKSITWTINDDHIGMGIAESEIPASEFQAANPIYILMFGLALSALWGFLATHGLDPSTPVKFALGMFQLGLAFVIFWWGAQVANERGMSSMFWLLLGYLSLTTGELCLSPVGLSMVTKLSPKHLVSTVMGGWFLATAFSNFLAGIIATFTGVGHGGEGAQVIPPPSETVAVYGGVFGQIAVVAIGAALVCLLISPVLTRWMHEDVEDTKSDDNDS